VCALPRGFVGGGWALARRGHHVFYLTARPEWLEPTTARWLTLRGFPPGIRHTTTGATGALNAAAQRFKQAELGAFIDRFGRAPDYGFGNRASDVAAYTDAGLDPRHAYSYQLDGALDGAQRLDDYRSLAAPFARLPLVCR
jgi:phosphatidate phosphatase PAH1